MSQPSFNVLFLCTHNACRSVIAESILNAIGADIAEAGSDSASSGSASSLAAFRFKGFSAGSCPSGRINPHALEMLNRLGYETTALHSKSWVDFAQPGAPVLDFIFTVCDDAANEVCPVWPGKPITAHWGVRDPSRFAGTPEQRHQAFDETHRILLQRIRAFISLPLATLDEVSLKTKLGEIAHRS